MCIRDRYWIITGSFKTGAAINATTPEWWPSQWVLTNYQKLFSGKSAPLWQLAVPFGSKFSANGEPIYFSVGPTAPAAIRWMINTVFMAVMSMILTCITAAMAGYALAKKRFVGRKLLFTLIVCAMALPKQVILIPLLREMSSLNLYNTIWAVIFPIVGWPFGVFLMKQFSEGIPTEMLEAARIDGASEAKTFIDIVLPMVKPGKMCIRDSACTAPPASRERAITAVIQTETVFFIIIYPLFLLCVAAGVCTRFCRFILDTNEPPSELHGFEIFSKKRKKPVCTVLNDRLCIPPEHPSNFHLGDPNRKNRVEGKRIEKSWIFQIIVH